MSFYFSSILYIFSKLVGIIPLLITLIAITQLLKKDKSTDVYLMLVGNIFLLIQGAILGNIYEYYLKFDRSINIQLLGIITTAFSIYAITFSIIFSIGFYLFIKRKINEQY